MSRCALKDVDPVVIGGKVCGPYYVAVVCEHRGIQDNEGEVLIEGGGAMHGLHTGAE